MVITSKGTAAAVDLFLTDAPALEEACQAASAYVRGKSAQIDTIAERQADDSSQRLQKAHDAIHNDPNVQQLVDIFGATVEPDSIQPLNDGPDPGQQ